MSYLVLFGILMLALWVVKLLFESKSTHWANSNAVHRFREAIDHLNLSAAGTSGNTPLQPIEANSGTGIILSKDLDLPRLISEYRVWTDQYGVGRNPQDVRFGQYLCMHYLQEGQTFPRLFYIENAAAAFRIAATQIDKEA